MNLPDALDVSGWLGMTSLGAEYAYLMLTTHDPEVLERLPRVVALFGLSPQPQSRWWPSQVGHVELRGKQWISLFSGQKLVIDAPMPAEWVDMARDRKQIVLVVGHRPLAEGGDVDRYVDQIGDRCSIGILPVTSLQGRPVGVL